MSSLCGRSNLTVVCLFVLEALVRAVLSIIITLEVILMYILITRKYVANELLLMIIVSTIFFEARIRPYSMENLPQTNTSLAQAARLSMLNPKQKDTLKIYVWLMLTDKKIKYNSFNGSLIFLSSTRHVLLYKFDMGFGHQVIFNMISTNLIFEYHTTTCNQKFT